MPRDVSLLYCERSAAPSHGARPPRRGDRLTQLARRPAAIDRHETCPVTCEGSVRAEKHYDLRDLLRVAPTTERNYAPALSISPITTLAPSRPKATAVARPMPDAPPVTTTTLSAMRYAIQLPPAVNFARTWAGQTGKARQLIQTLRRRFRRELLTRDEAHRIAAVFAKLPRPSSGRVTREGTSERHGTLIQEAVARCKQRQ